MFWKIKKTLDSKLGKTIIQFRCDGCMAHIHNFEFIGTIVERLEPLKDVNCKDNYNYRVRIEKDNTGYEFRSNPDKPKYRNVPAWYLQRLEGDYYVIYD